MNIAAMNVRICFQKSSVVTDEIGNHTNEWVDYFSCYATVIRPQMKQIRQGRR